MNGATSELNKIFGVIINYKISWSNHINLTASKIGKSIDKLYKVRYILNELSCLQLYQNLVKPYLNFCCLN